METAGHFQLMKQAMNVV